MTRRRASARLAREQSRGTPMGLARRRFMAGTAAPAAEPDASRAAMAQADMSLAPSGVGSNQHILGEWFAKEAGIKLDHVPYRGAGQAVNDFIAGHILIGVLGPTALIPHYKTGTLRFLAQSSKVRAQSLPDVPTFEEAGFKGMVLDAWYGAFVPTGTAAVIIYRLNAEMNRAVGDPAVRDSLLQTATEPVGGSAEQFGGVVREASAKSARLAKELNIKI